MCAKNYATEGGAVKEAHLSLADFRAICVFTVLFTFLASGAGYPQTAPAAPPTAPATTAPAIHIDSVAVFPQATSQNTSTQNFVVEINGTGFASITSMADVHLAVLPATGVAPNPVPALSRSLDNSKILAQFTAPPNYVLEEVVLSAGTSFVTFDTGSSACDFNAKVKLTPQIVPKSQAGNKYGNGVAKNFHAIQLSIVNECPMAIVVPLGGISVVSDNQAAGGKDDSCTEKGRLVPFSLDHVTSIFSTDRKLTGRRAIYFNAVQALATLGSAFEPFFGHGFTQGVAILGGGFTTASKEVLVDMSAEQLQNITSQSFGSTEQVASHGSLQKFVFIRRNEKCKKGPIETDLSTGKFTVYWELSPASAEAPKTLTAPAAQPASAPPAPR